MFVYRFEHVTCSGSDNNHGPTGTLDCWADGGPEFGWNGPCPDMIPAHWRCAVTIEQFLSWWGYKTKPREYDGWSLIEYELSDADEGTYWENEWQQIVFDTYMSRRVGAVDVADVEALALDRKANSVEMSIAGLIVFG